MRNTPTLGPINKLPKSRVRPAESLLGGKQAIHVKMREMALAKEADTKLPTRDQLSAAFGVSSATINNVLDDLEEQNVIYRVRGSGIYVSPRLHRKSIAIVLRSDYIEQVEVSPFWSYLWASLSKKAQDRVESKNQDFTLHIISSTETDLPSSLTKLIETGQVQGVVGIGLIVSWTEWIKQQGVTVFAFAGAGDYHVSINTDQIVEIGVSKLIEQGCRRIGLIGWANERPDDGVTERIRALFPRVLALHGLEFDPQHIYWEFVEGSLLEYGFRTTMTMLTHPTVPPPDSLVIMNDMVTNGVLVALNKLGLRLGEDIKIATHANVGSPILYGYKDDMIVIAVDAARIVDRLFEIMDQILSGHGRGAPNQVLISLQLREATMQLQETR